MDWEEWNKMLYEPNKIKWKIGDIVIHDADAKEERMLMKVVDLIYYMGDNLYVTVYINLSDKTKWKNDLKFLHDPARFGIGVV